MTLPELGAKLLAERSVAAHPASLSRGLIQAGFSCKKTLLACEAERADAKEARNELHPASRTCARESVG
jgi:hypothetical protein